MIFASYWGSPLVKFSKFKNFLWVCWFLCKNLSNFVSLPWKFHNPYCHNAHHTIASPSGFKKLSTPLVSHLYSNWWILNLVLTSIHTYIQGFKKVILYLPNWTSTMSTKFGPDFKKIKWFENWSYQKVNFRKNVVLEWYSSLLFLSFRYYKLYLLDNAV